MWNTSQFFLLVLLFQKTNDGWTCLKTPTRLYLRRRICCVVESVPLRHTVHRHYGRGDEWQDMRQSFRRHYRRRVDAGLFWTTEECVWDLERFIFVCAVHCIWRPSYTVNYTQAQRVRICCHNTDLVHVKGHNRTTLVILSKNCTRLPDDGSSVIRNMLEHFYIFYNFNYIYILYFAL